MAGQASPSLTSRLVCELKTKGEEEREHAFDKRLAVAKQLIGTDGVSFLQTNKHNSTCWPYCHSHALPPRW